MPTNETRSLVIAMIAAGYSQQEVGAVIGIAKPTLARHYRTALRHGYTLILERLAGRLIALALAGDLRAAQFFLERRAGWVVPRHRHNVAVANAAQSLEVSFRRADATPSRGDEVVELSVPRTAPDR